MSPNYNAYETTGDDSETNSDNSGNDNERSPELITTPYSMFEGRLGAVFGTDSDFGDSLGIAVEDITVIDGCLYVDADKEKFKLFSWQEANDMSPDERVERGEEPHATDANDFMRKKYAGNEKEYELVAARVPPVEDEDGEVVVEPSSRTRNVTFTGDGVEFSEYEDLGGDVVPFGDVIMWYNGSQENGPSVSARSLAETLTEYGENAVADEDTIFGWLTDTSGSNIVRDDLADEQLRFFTVTREGENFTYNLPIVEDIGTGSRIYPNNRMEDEEGDSDSGGIPDSASYAEPVADFLQSGERLELTEGRAGELLDDLAADDDNALNEELIEEAGGRDHLVEQVV